MVKGRITVKDLIGNCLADRAAELAAETAEANPNEVLRVGWEFSRARAIAKRLAVIQAEVWRKTQGLKNYEEVKVPEEQNFDLIKEVQNQEEELDAKGHDLVRKGKWVKCARCGDRRLAKNRRHWATSPCKGTGAKRSRPDPKSGEEE